MHETGTCLLLCCVFFGDSLFNVHYIAEHAEINLIRYGLYGRCFEATAANAAKVSSTKNHCMNIETYQNIA